MTFNVFLTTVENKMYSLFEDIFVEGVDDSQFANNSKKVNSSKKKHVWYFYKSIKNEKLWNEINENDWCMFRINTKYVFAGKIDKKYNNDKIKNKIQLKLNSKQSIYVLSFSKLIESDLNALKTNRIFGFEKAFIKMHKILFLRVKDKYVINILKDFKIFENFLTGKQNIIKKSPGKEKNSNEIQLNSIMNDEEPPGNIKTQVTRKIRNTTRTKLLKEKYNNNCQICSIELKISKIEKYSEVHHIWPLGKDGKDNFNNMLVLCPNHHTQFDTAFIGFNKNKHMEIVDINGNTVGKLNHIKEHVLDKENIIYHINRMDKL
jgi:predicted restriction endonuclease